MSTTAEKYLYRRFRLNGRLLEIRRVEDGNRPEVVVRHVNDDDELSANEFQLTLCFLLKYGTLMRPVGDVVAPKHELAGIGS